MTDELTNISDILSSLQRNLKSPKDKRNNFGNFQYRNAEGILEAYKEEIKKVIYPSDLTLTHHFELSLLGGRIFAVCDSILDIKGERVLANGFAEIDVTKKGMDQAQVSGAATSYAKKYALCNLFAIDDSKDDPDSKEKPNEEEQKKNAFGFTKSFGDEVNEDMKDIQRKKNEEEFDCIKLAIMNLGSVSELEAAWISKKKEIASLKKYAPDLHAELQSIAVREKERIMGV